MLMITPGNNQTDDDVRAYVPEKLTRRSAERSRRLAVPRRAVEFAPGWQLAFRPAPDNEAWAEAGVPVEIDFRIDGETVHLRTVWPVLDSLIHQAEPRIRIDDLDMSLIAALLETHLITQVEALEQMIGAKCSVEGVSKRQDHTTLSHLDLSLTMNVSNDPYPASIYASPSILGMLASVWERSETVFSAGLAPSFLFAARVAVSSISRAGLRGLVTGDALLFDRVAPEGGIALCIGEHLSTVGRITDNGLVTAGAVFSSNNPYLMGEFFMSDSDFETEGGAAALDDASIGSLPVRLVFEIGRREMALDELRDISVGTPIALHKPASAVVEILANGRRVGAGEMVLIGDQLGVRITRLNGNA